MPCMPEPCLARIVLLIILEVSTGEVEFADRGVEHPLPAILGSGEEAERRVGVGGPLKRGLGICDGVRSLVKSVDRDESRARRSDIFLRLGVGILDLGVFGGCSGCSFGMIGLRFGESTLLMLRRI